MSKDAVALILEGVEQPVAPRAEFAEALLDRLIDELEVTQQSEPGRRFGLRLSPRRLVSLAAAALALVVAIVLVVVPRPQSAFAIVERAIRDFKQVPPFLATISGTVPAGQVAFETEREIAEDRVFRYRLAYRDAAAWRLEVIENSSPTHPPGAAGSFQVRAGGTLSVYDAAGNTFDEAEFPKAYSPLGLLRWGGTEAEALSLWRRRCADAEVAGDEEVAGRRARHLRCTGDAGSIGLWVDTDTGLMLRVVSEERTPQPPRPAPGPIGFSPGTRFEITSLVYDPEFAEGTFVFVPPTGAREAAPTEEAEPPPVDLAVGRVAPTWSGPLLDGGTLEIASLRGKPTVVYLWAEWCVPCIGAPLEAFDASFRARSREIAFVSLAWEAEADATRAVVVPAGYRFPVVLDPDGAIGRRWGLRGIPTLVFLDPDGRFRGAILGPVGARDLDRLLDALVEGKPLPTVTPQGGTP